MDTTSPVREQIYSAIRAFTCATVAEAESATKAIISLVNNALPYDGPDDGGCVRCGSVPTSTGRLCNTCLDADAVRDGDDIIRRQVTAAIDAFAQSGIEFRAPWECDLDDLERERFDALIRALSAAAKVSP